MQKHAETLWAASRMRRVAHAKRTTAATSHRHGDACGPESHRLLPDNLAR
jgi:hypothetical protein